MPDENKPAADTGEPTENVHSAAPAPEESVRDGERSEVVDELADDVAKQGTVHVPLGT